MASPSERALSLLEYHVLLAVAGGPVHGYAVRDIVEEESQGTLAPRPGTLYRVIARLMTSGCLAEAEVADDGRHPGRDRRYYELTPEGRRVLAEEARRLQTAAALARDRLSLGRS